MYRKLFYIVDNVYDIVDLVSTMIKLGKKKILILGSSERASKEILKKINKKCENKFELNSYGLVSEGTVCLFQTIHETPRESAAITILFNKDGVLDELKIKNFL